jgi:uncharacterized protein YkuJ
VSKVKEGRKEGALSIPRIKIIEFQIPQFEVALKNSFPFDTIDGISIEIIF